MAQTALFVSPMARKKTVSGKYNPNSFRVISIDAENHLPPPTVTSFLPKSNIIGQPKEPHSVSAEFEQRYNRPNATNVGFLRQDVRLLNEPICAVQTESTREEQGDWWPSRVSSEPHVVPSHPLDTTVREDFQWRGQGLSQTLRNSSNPNKTPALGVAPVNLLRDPSGKQRFWKEGISYEHQYNCRLDPQYPIRGKRHGGFVWDRFADREVDQMVKKYHYNQTPSPAKQAEIREVEMLPDAVSTAQKLEGSIKSPPGPQVEPDMNKSTAACKVSSSPSHEDHQSLGSTPITKVETMPPVAT